MAEMDQNSGTPAPTPGSSTPRPPTSGSPTSGSPTSGSSTPRPPTSGSPTPGSSASGPGVPAPAAASAASASGAPGPAAGLAAPAGAQAPPLRAREVRKSYPSGETRIEVLRGVDLEVRPGEVIAIVGSSGSGKSTLLNVLGALDRPDSGEIRYGGQDVVPLGEEERAHLRQRHVGFVFQYHHLLAEFTALENVVIPLLLAGHEPRAARDRAANYLGLVGLEHRLEHPPHRLSGGEQQRVAIARAIAGDPALVLADEPTGNLDRQTGEGVFELLYSLARNRLQSWVVATHNEYLAGRADKRWRVADGRLRAQP